MQSTTTGTPIGGDKGKVAMGITNKQGGDETSGLYDLKELASSAKKRRTQRLSSEMDAQQSLLQSSAALEAVALPDPKKSQAMAIPVIGLDSPSGANTTKIKATQSSSLASVNATELPSATSGSKTWLLVGVALVAIAGAAAFMLLKNNESTTEAAPSAAKASAAVALDDSETPTAVQALPEATEDQALDEAVEPEQAEDAVEVQPLVEDQGANGANADLTKDASKDTAKTATTDKANAKVESKNSDKLVAKSSAKDGEAKDSAAADTEVSKTTKGKTEKVPVKTEDLGSNASVDDILSSVTGGVDSTAKVEDTDKGPSKKELDRGDVAKAMKQISPAAKACFSAEEFSGMVTVKYSVGSDGKVTGAQATGAHKTSKTGACVAEAVSKAKFPAFSGNPMSFTFPILLSP